LNNFSRRQVFWPRGSPPRGGVFVTKKTPGGGGGNNPCVGGGGGGRGHKASFREGKKTAKHTFWQKKKPFNHRMGPQGIFIFVGQDLLCPNWAVGKKTKKKLFFSVFFWGSPQTPPRGAGLLPHNTNKRLGGGVGLGSSPILRVNPLNAGDQKNKTGKREKRFLIFCCFARNYYGLFLNGQVSGGPRGGGPGVFVCGSRAGGWRGARPPPVFLVGGIYRNTGPVF